MKYTDRLMEEINNKEWKGFIFLGLGEDGGVSFGLEGLSLEEAALLSKTLDYKLHQKIENFMEETRRKTK